MNNSYIKHASDWTLSGWAVYDHTPEKIMNDYKASDSLLLARLKKVSWQPTRNKNSLLCVLKVWFEVKLEMYDVQLSINSERWGPISL